MGDKKVIYFPNLDGIRFFAFFAVFWAHQFFFKINYDNFKAGYFSKVFFNNGDLGVTLFFVLSGFLITFILLNEKRDRSEINIKRFYIRRILRIWPLYFLNIFVGVFLLTKLQGSEFANVFGLTENIKLDSVNIASFLVFMGNFFLPPESGHNINFFVLILWSVCVEEQFYLIWPLVLSIVNKKYLSLVLIAIILLATVYRIFIAKGSFDEVQHYTFSCISDLAVGALSANLYFNNRKVKSVFNNFGQIRAAILYMLIIAGLFFRQIDFSSISFNTLVFCLSPLFFSVLFAFLIMEQNFSTKSFFKFSRLKHFSLFGKYTYFAYCFHYHIFFIVAYGLYLFAGEMVLNPGLVISIAEIGLSYILIFF